VAEIYLTKKEHKDLKTRAKREGKSMSQIVREALGEKNENQICI